MEFLNGKVVVVTGASSGIGKALVDDALAQGAMVGGCARNLPKMQELFVGSDASRLLLHAADVSKEEDSNTFIKAVIEKWGKIDVIIANAGISMRALFDETDTSVIREVMNINFWGAVYCIHAALPYLKQTQGVVVGISSIAGYRGLPGRTGYSASKFALQGFLEALRTEMLYTGVHVMWVSPGFTASNIRNTARNAQGESQAETPINESKLMSAEQCASIILNGIHKRKRTIVMTGQGKLTVWLNKLFPDLADKLVYNHFLKEPGSPLAKYNTNAKR